MFYIDKTISRNPPKHQTISSLCDQLVSWASPDKERGVPWNSISKILQKPSKPKR